MEEKHEMDKRIEAAVRSAIEAGITDIEEKIRAAIKVGVVFATCVAQSGYFVDIYAKTGHLLGQLS